MHSYVRLQLTQRIHDMDNVANELTPLYPGHIFGNNSKHYAHTRHSSLLSNAIKDPDNKHYNAYHCYDVQVSGILVDVSPVVTKLQSGISKYRIPNQ